MAFAVNPVNFSTAFATFLAASIDNGTWNDVLTTLKEDDSDFPAVRATQIFENSGQLWANLVDNFIQKAWERFTALEAHAPDHAAGGSDPIKLDNLAAPDDNTDLNSTVTEHGLLKKLSGNASEFLDGQGNYNAPSGGGDAIRRGFIDGLRTSRDSGDPIHDLNIEVGECRDSTDAADIVLPAEITKRIDANWSLGDDGGGLDTGSVAANTFYYPYVIKRSDTGVVDAILSASIVAPTLTGAQADYDLFRRAGFILTDGSSEILPFTHTADNKLIWDASFDDLSTPTPSTTAALLTLTAPPEKMTAILTGFINGSATGKLLRIHPGSMPVPPTDADWLFIRQNHVANISVIGDMEFETNASGQIRYKANTTTSIQVDIRLRGLIDLRGQNL